MRHLTACLPKDLVPCDVLVELLDDTVGAKKYAPEVIVKANDATTEIVELSDGRKLDYGTLSFCYSQKTRKGSQSMPRWWKVEHDSRSGLPPPEHMRRPLIGPNIVDFSVGEWCPTPDGTGKPEAVAISIRTERHGDLVLRLKTPKAVDNLIQMLLRHKRRVWPDSR